MQGDWLKASEFLDNNDFDRAGYYIDRVGTHCTGTYISMRSIELVPRYQCVVTMTLIEPATTCISIVLKWYL